MKIRNLFLAALALCAAVPSLAEETQVITVTPLKGTDEYSVALSKVVQIVIENNTVALVDNSNTTLYSRPLSECRSLVFGKGTPTSIADIVVPDESISITAEGNSVRMSGLADGDAVRVYSLSGALQTQGAAPVVSLAGLQKGVYVVVAGAAAAKVTVK